MKPQRIIIIFKLPINNVVWYCLVLSYCIFYHACFFCFIFFFIIWHITKFRFVFVYAFSAKDKKNMNLVLSYKNDRRENNDINAWSHLILLQNRKYFCLIWHFTGSEESYLLSPILSCQRKVTNLARNLGLYSK